MERAEEQGQGALQALEDYGSISEDESSPDGVPDHGPGRSTSPRPCKRTHPQHKSAHARPMCMLSRTTQTFEHAHALKTTSCILVPTMSCSCRGLVTRSCDSSHVQVSSCMDHCPSPTTRTETRCGLHCYGRACIGYKTTENGGPAQSMLPNGVLPCIGSQAFANASSRTMSRHSPSTLTRDIMNLG